MTLNLDMEYLKKPSDMIRVFEPTTKRIAQFGQMLMDKYLYTSDEYRTPEGIMSILAAYFPYRADQMVRPHNVWYEIGDWGGLLGFTGIIPGYRCSSLLKLWDDSLWGPTLARDLKTLSRRFMDEYKLKRCSLITADEKMKDMAVKLFGFKVEGAQRYGFSWNGKLFTQFMLRRIIEDGKEV